MAAPALEAQNLMLSWGDFAVAEGVSVHVDEGELACIVGRSGCGKTTLFHALAGLEKPADGRVLLRGEDGITRAKNMEGHTYATWGMPV